MSWRGKGMFNAQQKLLRGLNRKPPETIKKWNIKKGDMVQVLAGRDKGRQGKVVATDHNRNRLYVQGMNTHVVYMESANFSGRMQRESPLHYSNVALIDPEDNEPCRVRYMYTESGERVRVSRRSGRVIPNPVREKDFSVDAYPDGLMDTKPEMANHVTYIPSLVTFDEEMAQKYEPAVLLKSTSNQVHDTATDSQKLATSTTTT